MVTLQSILELTKTTGADKEGAVFSGIAAIDDALPHQVSFARSGKDPIQTQAGACFIHPSQISRLPESVMPLLSEDPYKAFVLLARFLYPSEPVAPFVHKTAIIASDARVHASCSIGPGVVIEADVIVGKGTSIGAYSILGKGVVVGEDCSIESHVTLMHASIGQKVCIKAGARIGQRGFGFLMEKEGMIDIPHIGLVRIGDRVEIGAQCTIDRGTFQDTCIGDDSRIDNLVQIGHNVKIGKRVVLAAQCGISGSCIIGDGCMLGGQVGLADHMTLAPGTRVAAKSGVMRSTREACVLAGIPAVPAGQWRRQVVHLEKSVRLPLGNKEGV